MANMQNISTGYTPEFGLGALYQGFNAANADQSNELELIKQFLANQHAQVQNPLDEQTSAQNLLINNFKTSPEYQTGMRDVASGQGMTTLAAGQTAAGLQPFVEKSGKREAENRFIQADVQNQIYQLDDLIQTEQNPAQRAFLERTRGDMLRNLRETPKFTGQRELKETGTDSNEYIAELKADLARTLAAAKTTGKGDPKTAQETMQRIQEKKRRGEELTDADIEVYNLASETVLAIAAAKIQPGTMVNPNVAPDVLLPKPAQPAPPTLGGPSKAGATIKYDSQGNRIQ